MLQIKIMTRAAYVQRIYEWVQLMLVGPIMDIESKILKLLYVIKIVCTIFITRSRPLCFILVGLFFHLFACFLFSPWSHNNNNCFICLCSSILYGWQFHIWEHRKRGHMTFPNTGKLCSSQDDLKCSNYWLFPLAGNAANKHVKFSEPTSVQLLSLTCGQNKNWNRIYPDKYKVSCLKQLFSKPNNQIKNKGKWILFLETLIQTIVNISEMRC